MPIRKVADKQIIISSIQTAKRAGEKLGMDTDILAKSQIEDILELSTKQSSKTKKGISKFLEETIEKIKKNLKKPKIEATKDINAKTLSKTQHQVNAKTQVDTISNATQKLKTTKSKISPKVKITSKI